MKADDYIKQAIASTYIGVPHQLPPQIIDCRYAPPVRDSDVPDRYVRGDHDFHTCIPVESAASYVGHQAAAVRYLAKQFFAGLEGGE
jgi:hypothetical protein